MEDKLRDIIKQLKTGATSSSTQPAVPCENEHALRAVIYNNVATALEALLPPPEAEVAKEAKTSPPAFG